jgi:hypothetical protein
MAANDPLRDPSWADPDVPDDLDQVPSRYLSAVGFAARIVRLIVRLKREGHAPGAILDSAQALCVSVVLGHAEEHEDGHGDGD